MKTTHTFEPWQISNGGPLYKRIINQNGVLVAECNSAVAGAAVKNAANAARIVACVNACAGLSDPAADLALLRNRVADLLADNSRLAELSYAERETNTALRADLAALREALQAMLHAYDIGQPASDGSAIALARAALARTERRPA